ncbi:MAG: type II toxin-antitoxin system PemK/MazF family toxin [Methanomicrobium sp.]|nr:type II toxin-antitoxin system PemK/MazF family toxin [Methanomicrobium sp.]
MKGNIVLVPFPFTDLTASKIRPALVLYEGGDDTVLAFISSRILKGEIPKGSVLINESHPEFFRSGLKTTSVIRLDKVATVLSSLIIGELGIAGPNICNMVNNAIDNLYHL